MHPALISRCRDLQLSVFPAKDFEYKLLINFNERCLKSGFRRFNIPPCGLFQFGKAAADLQLLQLGV